MQTLYIETTIVSYLVARPSRDLVIAAHQKVTRQWWQNRKLSYQCVTSTEVLREASLGDPGMKRLRLNALMELPVFPVTDKVTELAEGILRKGLLPQTALSDAIHAAVTSLHSVDILLTWNCRHLANPHIVRQMRGFMRERKLVLPEICTPIELAAD